MHRPLEIAALVSASKSEPKSCDAGCIGRASTDGHRTRGGLIKVPAGWANASRQGLCGTAGVPMPVNAESPLALPTEDRILLYFSDFRNMEGIDDRRKRAMDERVKRLEDYTRAVMTAWKDGRVTATERLLVEQLRENLGISREEQDRIESQVIEEVLENRTGIYGAVAEEALEDGPITEDERELLEALRKKLGLSAHDCREVEAEIMKPAS